MGLEGRARPEQHFKSGHRYSRILKSKHQWQNLSIIKGFCLFIDSFSWKFLFMFLFLIGSQIVFFSSWLRWQKWGMGRTSALHWEGFFIVQRIFIAIINWTYVVFARDTVDLLGCDSSPRRQDIYWGKSEASTSASGEDLPKEHYCYSSGVLTMYSPEEELISHFSVRNTPKPICTNCTKKNPASQPGLFWLNNHMVRQTVNPNLPPKTGKHRAVFLCACSSVFFHDSLTWVYLASIFHCVINHLLQTVK